MTKSDFLGECMSDFKTLTIPQFAQAFCNQCQNRECLRSLFSNSTTQKKLQKHQELSKFVDPTKVKNVPDFFVSLKLTQLPKRFDFQEVVTVQTASQPIVAHQTPEQPKPAAPKMKEIRAKPGDTIKFP